MNNKHESRPKAAVSSEQWNRVVERLGEILDGSDAARLIAKETDPVVRTMLESLWAKHARAEASTFLLNQPVTVVDELGWEGPPVFAPAQVLAGRFGVLRMLGRGGMGEVYLAEDRRLQELVALKTIRHPLVTDLSVRERFLTEVQNARRVTHPHVCRIFDLFDEGSTPFFSMEYVPGPTLAETLSTGLPDLERARTLAIQIAEGLWAAHRTGILHCDLKPANIILAGSGKTTRAVITDFGLAHALTRADGDPNAAEAEGAPIGTVGYMAPELLRGEPASVQSDIYAYGKVLNELMPRTRVATSCLQAEARLRPDSLDPVLKALKGTSSRRSWIVGALALAAAGAGTYLTERTPRYPLGSRQRLRVNGFRSADLEQARVLQNLVVLALRQSPLLSVLGQRAYRTGKGAAPLAAGVSLPLLDLLSTAREERAGLVLDGSVESAGRGLRLILAVYEPQRGEAVYKVAREVGDARQVVKLAESATQDLRAQFGESSSISRSTYTPLEAVTSSVPEAVDLYFRAVFFYEQANSAAALTLLDQAIQFDSEFALAHHYRGLALGSQGRLESALAASERALTLAQRVSTRERNWIESLYYNFAANWMESANSLRRNTLLFPDEAVFERQYAFAEAAMGRYEEAIPHNQRAVQLDPFAINNASELMVNLAEAGRADEAAQALTEFERQGLSNGLFCYPAGEIAMQQGNYRTAYNKFQELGRESSGRQRWGRLMSLAPLVMLGQFDTAIRQLEGDLAYGMADQEPLKEETRSYIRRSWLAELCMLKDRPSKASEQAEYLVNLKSLPCNLNPIREATLLAARIGELRLVELGLDSLRVIAKRWQSTQTQGVAWLAEARWQEMNGDAAADATYAKAKGAWPDPLNLYTVARWEAKLERTDALMATLDELDRLKGKIYKSYFAGYVVLGWIERARCLVKLSHLDEALRIYKRVLLTWENPETSGLLMSAIRSEHSGIIERMKQ